MKMVTIAGDEVPFAALLHELGLTASESTIRDRIRRGWTAEDAFGIPVRGYHAPGRPVGPSPEAIARKRAITAKWKAKQKKERNRR